MDDIVEHNADPAALAAAEAALAADNEAAQKLAESTKKHIAVLRKELAQGRKHDEKAREGYVDDRRVAAGDTPWLVDTNLVQTIIEILMAFVYAKDPDISVTVSESVGESRAKAYADMTETLQIVVSRLLKKASLKKKAKKQVRTAMTVGVGWLKATMQTRTERDSIIVNEINDLKQQLDNIAAIKATLADPQQCKDHEVLEAQLRANMTALEQKAERTIALGLALDVMDPNDVQVSPECGMLEDYLDAPWIAQRYYKSRAWVQSLTKWSDEILSKANCYHQRLRSTDAEGGVRMEWTKAENASAESVDGFLLVEEVWHKNDGVIYTLVDGVHEHYARAPYAPRQSSRFYDLFRLAFHDIDGERHPHSDTRMLKKLQDEYGRTRSNQAEHRKRAIPATIFNSSRVDETQAKKLQGAEIAEMIGIDVGDTDDIRKLFAEKSYPQFDPNLYDVQRVLQDIEKVSGAQDAMQSSVAVEKTATEAEIQNNGFGARVGTRKDALEDMLTELANHVAELAMQVCDESFVQRLAGDNAIWPALTIDEIMYGFDIEVTAGSTGKPNTAAMRNAWSTALPLLEKMVTVIGNFRAQGPQMEWAAAPYVAMVRETFRRLGDRTDADKFLPMPPPPAVDPVTGLPVPGGVGVDPATGQPAPPMAPVMSAAGGANAQTPPPAATPPTS